MMHLTDFSGNPLGFKQDAVNLESSTPHEGQGVSNGTNGSYGGAAAAPTSGPAPRIRRRNRMITSCLECRRRKLKCDKQHPCANCTKNSRDCLFLAPALDSAAQLKLTEIKEKMGSLERVLEQDVAKKGAKNGARRDGGHVYIREAEEEIDFAPEPEDERDLEPTPLAISDAVYGNDGDDDLADLGFQMGKLRLTDRIGGFFRPKMAEELTVTLNDERNDHRSPPEKEASPEHPEPSMLTSSGADRTFLSPGPTYIAPSSSFFFSSGNASASLIDFLPSRTVADRLLNQYWECVHPMCRLVHRPSFERRYAIFWDDVQMGIEPANSLQAVIFAAIFSGVVSMAEQAILLEFGVSKKDLVDNFQMGTETALGRANIIRTTKIETLQAFIMYMIPLCRGEVSRSHSALVGTAIRIAECMGLHRDGTEYGMDPVETHVRRLIWYQICFLDIRTCEAQGPRPGIRVDEFSTQLPLNVDDLELEIPNPPTEHAKRWTDMTLSLIRFECNEIHRVIWVDRPRLEKKKISLTAVLGKVENFRRSMKEKYVSFIDDAVPVQHCGRVILEILTLRMHAMVLHRYHNSVAHVIPDRLRQIIITSGIATMESAIELETSLALAPYAWYAGALNQYHYALLLLMEVFAFPQRREADRIWACLDYVFETPNPNLPKTEKARWVVTEVRNKMGIYVDARKVRAPKDMTLRFGQSPPLGVGQGPPVGVGKMKAEVAQSSLSSLSSLGPVTFFAPPQSLLGRQGAGAGAGANAVANAGISVAPAQANTMITPPASQPGSGGGDDKMVDIDWYEWDKLFPPDINTGELNFIPATTID